MKYTYICDKCVEQSTGRPVGSLSIAEYNQAVSQFAVSIEHGINEVVEIICPTCSAVMRKVVHIHSTFVRGYGLKDKRGAKADMNLYQMTTGVDPYGEHRKAHEKSDLVGRLRKQKDFNPRAKPVFVRKK